MNHTPGPWKISHGGTIEDDGFSIVTDNAAARHIKVITESWPYSIVDRQHREELSANARLIAAAPELLAALESYVGKFGNCGKVYEAGRAAIEKAKGTI
jgi:hypothetical protein